MVPVMGPIVPLPKRLCSMRSPSRKLDIGSGTKSGSTSAGLGRDCMADLISQADAAVAEGLETGAAPAVRP